MKNKNKLIIALGAIALASSNVVAFPQTISAPDELLERCESFRNMSRFQLRRFINSNPDDPCIEIASLYLTTAAAPTVITENNY